MSAKVPSSPALQLQLQKAPQDLHIRTGKPSHHSNVAGHCLCDVTTYSADNTAAVSGMTAIHLKCRQAVWKDSEAVLGQL